MKAPLRSLSLVLPLIAALYAPFLGGGFIVDDFVHLDRLTDARSIATLVTTPDAFQFYRPLTQVSMQLDVWLFGRNAAGFRVVNLTLHAAVLGIAFVVARLVLAQPVAAVLAATVFALTPKAHPAAVLWISARADLLMSLFSLVAVVAWIMWSRNGRTSWLALVFGAYAAALLSKETAFPLPLLLLVTPAATRAWRARVGAVLLLLGVAGAVYALRLSAGALTPSWGYEHYAMSTSLVRWARNARNYAGRMLPAPAALVVAVGITGLFVSRARAVMRDGLREHAASGGFSVAWAAVFMAPVLPIAARSELYLYLPVFGACLLAACLVEPLIRGIEHHRAVLIAIGLFVISLWTYQVFRSAELHRNLEFSAKLVAALENRGDLAGKPVTVTLVPKDAMTEHFLKETIDWTMPAVLQHALRSELPTGLVEYAGISAPRDATRLICEYRDGKVTLSP